MKVESKYIDCIKESIVYSIGQSASDNEDIIDAAEPDDIWFHIEGESSCHVIAHMPNDMKLNKKQLHKIVVQGAVLCRQNTKKITDPNAPVISTKVMNVTKTDKTGTVIAVNTKTI